MTDDTDKRVADAASAALTQSRENSAQLDALRRDVFAAIDKLSDDLRADIKSLARAGAPNMQTWAAWSVVILMVVLGIGSPICIGIMDSARRDREDGRREADRLDMKLQKEYQLINESMIERINSQKESVRDLDTRLQREFGQTTEAVKDTANTLRINGDVRYTEMMTRVALVEDWTKGQIKADLEELRQRRMNRETVPSKP